MKKATFLALISFMVALFGLLALSACSTKTVSQNNDYTQVKADTTSSTSSKLTPEQDQAHVSKKTASAQAKLPQGATLLPDGTVDYGPGAQKK